MNINEIEIMLSGKGSSDAIETVSNLICVGKIECMEIFDLMITTQDDKMKYNSAWVLSRIASKDIIFCKSIFSSLLEYYPSVQNYSIKRNLAKIIMLYLKKKGGNKSKILFDNEDSYNWEPIIESMFNDLLESKAPKGLKVLSGYSLGYLSIAYSWIKNELQYIISTQLDSPSMIAANKYINKVLNNK